MNTHLVYPLFQVYRVIFFMFSPGNRLTGVQLSDGIHNEDHTGNESIL